jgi:hypothetical protein
MIVNSGKQLTVPKPSTVLLFASGLVVLAGVRRKSRK